jgi:hypothetical protein
MSRRRSGPSKVVLAFVAILAACGSSDDGAKPDSGSGGRADGPAGTGGAVGLRDSATDPAVPGPDAADAMKPLSDAAVAGEVAAETAAGSDAGSVDGPVAETEAGEAGLSAIDATIDAIRVTVDGQDVPDAQADGVDAAGSVPDAPADGADAAFQPGPAVPVVVNSSNTATYNLADGTWKLFYFDAQASQLYVVSGLTGISRGYLGTSASVSPSSYEKATDPESGILYFTTATAQRYYLAVAVSGGGASGAFQVADGGRLLSLGSTTLSLTPSDAGDAYEVFRFPVSAGHGYTITMTGSSPPNIGLSAAERPERSTSGEFAYSDWGTMGPLPFNDVEIKATDVAQSTSGFYYLNMRVIAPITFTIAIAQL